MVKFNPDFVGAFDPYFIEWHYSIQLGGVIPASFYADSLEGAIVHIISIQNNREQYIGAVYELLGLGKKLHEVIEEGE